MRARKSLRWQEVGHQQQRQPQRQDLQATGNVIQEPDVALAMGNWGSVLLTSPAGNVPHTQTGPTNTIVAALVLMPLSSGIFKVEVKASFSDGTTGGALKHQLVVKQGATTGQLAGGVGVGKFGAFVGGAGSGGLSTFLGSSAQVLNVDAAGGGGLTFEGAAFGGVVISEDQQATLTGLLTANAIGAQNFEFAGLVDANGPVTQQKLAFAVGTALSPGKPVAFGLLVTDTAAHVVTYDSVSISVSEWPVG